MDRFRLLTGFLFGALVAVILAVLLTRQGPPDRQTAALALAQRQLAIQATLIDSLRSIEQAGLLANVLGLVDADLKERPDRTLGEETVARIATYSRYAAPYVPLCEGHLPSKLLSPQRGELLLTLVRLHLDPATWTRIKHLTSFTFAYLPGADLREADLRGIDLTGSYLREADLSGADLTQARLSGSMLWGCRLAGTRLGQANLKQADLSWADLGHADMDSADLGGAVLRAARLQHAQLAHARLSWADAQGASCQGADFSHADLSGIAFHQARLDSATLDSTNLSNAWLLAARMNRASLRGADLDRVIVLERDWFQRIKESQVQGVADLPEQFTLLDGRPKGKTGYRLEKIRKN